MPTRLALAFLFLGTLALPLGADIHLVPNPNAPLSGRTIIFSPGHGYIPDGSGWRWQRGVVHDLQEDIHTNEIFIEVVQRYLAGAGARVESVRERTFQLHEAIVDSDGSGYTESGSWTASTSVSGYYQQGYRWTSTSPTETATATFTPTLPAAGRYPVYVWFTSGSDRTTDARYTVHHAGGATTVSVDQSQPGAGWIFLGDFYFEAGSGGRVVLSNQSSDTGRVVIADAVRWGGGIGASGQPRWKEGAKAFLPYRGFSSSSGDVTIRPRYAVYLAGGDTTRWRSDFLYFALHTNASGSGSASTARGLSTFAYSNGRTPSWGTPGAVTYPTNPSPLTHQAEALRDSVQNEVLTAVRATMVAN